MDRLHFPHDRCDDRSAGGQDAHHAHPARDEFIVDVVVDPIPPPDHEDDCRRQHGRHDDRPSSHHGSPQPIQARQQEQSALGEQNSRCGECPGRSD